MENEKQKERDWPSELICVFREWENKEIVR